MTADLRPCCQQAAIDGLSEQPCPTCGTRTEVPPQTEALFDLPNLPDEPQQGGQHP